MRDEVTNFMPFFRSDYVMWKNFVLESVLRPGIDRFSQMSQLTRHLNNNSQKNSFFSIHFEFLKIFYMAITVGALQAPKFHNAAYAIFADFGELTIIKHRQTPRRRRAE